MDLDDLIRWEPSVEMRAWMVAQGLPDLAAVLPDEPIATAFEHIPAGAPVVVDFQLGLASRPRGDDGLPLA